MRVALQYDQLNVRDLYADRLERWVQGLQVGLHRPRHVAVRDADVRDPFVELAKLLGPADRGNGFP